MSKITKRSIADRIAGNCNVQVKDAERMVNDVFSTIFDLTMKDKHQVHFTRLGSFGVVEKAARPGRNPKTNESFVVQARTRMTFHIASTMKEDLNNA